VTVIEYGGKIVYDYRTSPTMLTKVLVGGIDVTRYVKTYTFDRSNGESIRIINITCAKTVTSLVTLDNNASVVVYRGWVSDVDEKIFDGFIDSYEPEGATINIVGKDPMANLVRRLVNYTYDSSVDLYGGKISELVRDIVIKWCGLYAGPFDNDDYTLALYPMQEATSIYDYSGNGYSSTSVVALTQSAGTYGNAVTFNGSTSEVLFGSIPALELTYNFAIEAYVTMTAAIAEGVIASYSKAGGGASSGWVLGVNSSGQAYFTISDASGETTVTGSTVLVAGTQYLVAGMFNGFDLNVSVNGVVDGHSEIETLVTYSGCDFRLGSRGSDTHLKGSIDEVRVSNWPRYASTYSDCFVDSGSAIVLGQFPCKNADPMDKIKRLAESLDYQCFYRAQTGKVYFQPKGAANNLSTIFVGGSNSNVVEVPKWKFDMTEMANEITVKGANTQVETQEAFDGTGAQLSFTLLRSPASAKVTVGGTLKEGGGFDADGLVLKDYAIDKDGKKIVFAIAPASGTGNVVVDYTYVIPVPVQDRNDSSVALYGLSQREFVYTDITNVADAQARVTNLLAKYSTPFIYSQIKVKGSAIIDLDVGQTIEVVDSINNVTRNTVINRHVIVYPSKYDELYLGDKEWRTAEWGANVEAKIKALQDELIRDGDYTTALRSGGSVVRLRPKYLKVEVRNSSGFMRWSDVTTSAWGSARWGTSDAEYYTYYEKTYY